MAMLLPSGPFCWPLILAAAPLAAGADDLRIGRAVERAELQYRIALRTLESSGRDETAAEVRLFREALQDAISGSTSSVRRNPRATTFMPAQCCRSTWRWSGR